jgi:thiopurine S-methyltransferase
VIGVELSPVALQSFLMEQGLPARRRVLEGFDSYETDGFKLFCGDYFKLTPALLGRVSAVYDRAALISWIPAARESYVKHLTSLTSPGTQMLLIAVEFPQEQMTGPPFPVTREDIENLYANHYSIEELGRHEILELEPRLKARGLTELREVCYRVTRL